MSTYGIRQYFSSATFHAYVPRDLWGELRLFWQCLYLSSCYRHLLKVWGISLVSGLAFNGEVFLLIIDWCCLCVCLPACLHVSRLVGCFWGHTLMFSFATSWLVYNSSVAAGKNPCTVHRTPFTKSINTSYDELQTCRHIMRQKSKKVQIMWSRTRYNALAKMDFLLILSER